MYLDLLQFVVVSIVLVMILIILVMILIVLRRKNKGPIRLIGPGTINDIYGLALALSVIPDAAEKPRISICHEPAAGELNVQVSLFPFL